ncbi:hypothetical protein [Halorubellus litoreus]|uniref:DUF8048 domain-containing protein n=1 Tax=Halorubellus litoreus TaxID=755308 RepID=A0ABD5VGH3_9EURY
MKDHPFPEEVLLLTAGDGVVKPGRLPELLSVVQADLSLRLQEYREHHECAYEDDHLVAFFVAADHWPAIADRLGFETGAVDATRSAHARFLLGLGTDVDRTDEFETALDVQDCVVIEKTAA